ncbi:lysine exporter LysO family protein [Pelistega europaea]|uniref:Lysine exporter LysO family protein n=1 Tax=Pelistega europaea TaxID=106147 RepID=A0A7Y4P3N7_9BURK|nr:lysine exporter LysO family protein [Pelistega europaea]NOL48646.1 lysine exporter LysO family protein [Pelistega europaea]
MDILISLLPICLAVLIGMVAGRFLPKPFSQMIARTLGPFVWVLLFAIGYFFGLELNNLKSVADVLKLATIFSIGISCTVWIVIHFLYDTKHRVQQQEQASNLGIAHVLMECACAFLAIILGACGAQLLIYLGWNTSFMPSTTVFLYILLFIIGVDIINAPMNFKALRPSILLMPIPIMLASSVAGVAIAWLMGMDIRHGLVFSGGFGWFSLSGVMVSAKLNEYYGAVALLTDLFRELFSIIVLFFLGAKSPNASVAVAGATAMDTTLPIIKKAASNHYIPLALYIGVLLSLIAPFWLGFLLSLFDK